MAFLPNQRQNTGFFVPTTGSFDIQQLQEVNVNTPEFKQLLVRLYETVNTIALAVNAKDTAYYPEEEFNTGGILFNGNIAQALQQPQIFRRRVTTGALGAGVKNVAHGLNPTAIWRAVAIYGAATDSTGPTFWPLPFAGVGVGNISVTIGATNVTINNNSGSTFTDSYVIFLYVKF